jgi:hypothetical protein
VPCSLQSAVRMIFQVSRWMDAGLAENEMGVNLGACQNVTAWVPIRDLDLNPDGPWKTRIGNMSLCTVCLCPPVLSSRVCTNV